MRTAVALAVALSLTGCGGGGGDTGRPGNPVVYERIQSLTDCVALQTEFDTAAGNHDRAEAGSSAAEAATGYMEAADERMKELDCY